MVKLILSILDSDKYFQGVVGVLKKESIAKNVIYVTTNKPYSVLESTLKAKKVAMDKFFFIDCISEHLHEKTLDLKNCVFIESPQSLTSISIAISEAVKGISGKKILFLDSLSIMLIYNDANTLGKFSGFLLNKMRAEGVDAVVLALGSDADSKLIKQIESIVDEVRR
jgi:KaiC/GvpD/RAD55 family RecA-like ATPase